jgi:hypothetical protein
MTKILIAAILLSIFIGCDAPRSRRDSGYDSTQYNPYAVNTSAYSPTVTDPNSVVADSNTTTPDATTSIPAEISHCQWSSDGNNGFQVSNTQHLGGYTLCQSSEDETIVYVQVQYPITSEDLCLIPNYYSGSRSIYIGEPRCLQIASNKEIYKVDLIKNRSGFESYSINGVMMMKDKAFVYPWPFAQAIKSPDAYIYCANWLDSYGDASFCTAFDSVGEYVAHQF